MTATTASYTNRYGRRQTRGWRPWLLIPKVIAVGIYLGGLAAATAVWFAGDFNALAADDPKRLWLIGLIRTLSVGVIVPALISSMLLGVGLLLQHPRQFLRMRWLQVKLLVVAATVPAGHLMMSSTLQALRRATESGQPDDAAGTRLGLTLVALLIASCGIVLIGRLKPRLGQNWARAYQRSQESGMTNQE